MPRQPRIDIEGGLYHILNRGIRKESIFQDRSDYTAFMECIRRAGEKYAFNLYCYVLMPNHFHLLLERLDEPLSKILKSVCGKYACYYNRKYNRSGHLFQGRFHAFICDREKYLLKLIKYIHHNPVRAAICRHPSHWEWSSYGCYTGQKGHIQIQTSQVLEYFSPDGDFSGEGFTGFDETDTAIEEGLYTPSGIPVIGGSAFRAEVLGKSRLRRKTAENRRFPLEELAVRVGNHFNVTLDDMRLRKGNGEISYARSVFCYIAHVCCGHKMVDIARFIYKDHSAVSHAISRIRIKSTEKEISCILN